MIALCALIAACNLPVKLMGNLKSHTEPVALPRTPGEGDTHWHPLAVAWVTTGSGSPPPPPSAILLTSLKLRSVITGTPSLPLNWKTL